MKSTRTLSIVVPIMNEELHIENCVSSLMEQEFPHEEMEILLVDGMSTDRTPEILKNLQARWPDTVRILQNPKKIQAAAMNIGMEAACGKYIVRADAHAKYPKEYCAKCIALLEETGAKNAGCIGNTVGRGTMGSAIAKMLTSPFGVGGSSFRVGAPSGYVDTVPFGTFETAYLREIGGFDERLARNEDNEINYRIRKLGGKIYMTSDMSFTYYCRDTIRGLVKMAWSNGLWTILSTKFCPGSMSVKYFVPMLFALSLIVMPVLCCFHWLFRLLFGAELLLYTALSLLSAFQKTHKFGQWLLVSILFPVFHIPYGLGSLWGLFKLGK